jgi:hypothetical protein
VTDTRFVPEAESLGQDLGIEAIGGADGVLLHPPECLRRDHPHRDSVGVFLFDFEVLVPEGGSNPGQDIEAESIGRQVADSRIASAQVIGRSLVDAGVREDRAQPFLVRRLWRVHPAGPPAPACGVSTLSLCTGTHVQGRMLRLDAGRSRRTGG